MPAITVDLTEEELDDLRAEAKKQGVSVKRLVHDILIEEVRMRQKQRFVEGATRHAREIMADFEERFPVGLR
ncbi:hypothetical protein [Streptomyces sp. T028]|uniref:hypothetical protein n=1 Tax=Streptomyces sp. T028 TaxID=3394379 RepID=UPI003A8C2571